MPADAGATIEVYVDDDAGVYGVAVLIRNYGLVEDDGELVPSCKLNAESTKLLMGALASCLERIESEGG